MENEQIAELFNRTNNHSAHIAELKQEQALQAQNIASLNDKMERMSIDQGQKHGELMASLKSLDKKVGQISRDHLINQGRSAVTKWLVPVLIAGVAGLVGFLSYVQAGGAP